MVALNTLHLTHVAGLRLGAAIPKQGITLETLRHLSLSCCAVIALSSLADNLRMPGLEEFSLLSAQTYFHCYTISCTEEAVTSAMADSLCQMFERSGAHVTVLNLNVQPCAFFTQLCMNLGALVNTLRVEFSEEHHPTEITDFFGELTVGSDREVSLLPNLVDLEVTSENLYHLFSGPTLERLVVSRWEQGGMVRLKKLRLRRFRFHDLQEFSFRKKASDGLANSSLALTLWKLRSEGLNVQWLDGYMLQLYPPSRRELPGDVDVLDDTRGYIPVAVSLMPSEKECLLANNDRSR